MNREYLHQLPKIDLHRHLEGSLRLETLFEILQQHPLDLSVSTIEELRPLVQVTNDPPTSDAFLSKFLVLRNFYRSPQLVKRLVYEAIVDAANDNVQYLELRFSPQALSRVRGFDLGEATDWVIESAQKASVDHSIKVRLIITLVRHDPIEQAEKVVQVAVDRLNRGIVGLDLAGDEVRFPPEPFIPLFREAKEAGLGITIHAGEWANAFGVFQALKKLGADRIGHGIRALENSNVLRALLDSESALEVCLTSNLQTGVIRNMAHHPLVDMLDVGLMATLNTDDPSVSDCTLTDEYEIAANVLGLGYAELRAMTLNAAKAAFLEDEERQQLLAHFVKVLPENGELVNSSPIPLTLV